MTFSLTERDRKLLAGLGFFCVAAILVVLAIMPLYVANKSLKELIAGNREEIAEMEHKAMELPRVRALNAAEHAALDEAQTELFPMLKSQDIDSLLIKKLMSHGLSARKLQITMPKEPSDVVGYAVAEGEGSNPEKDDAVWIASVRLEASGSIRAMDGLIDDLSLETPGVRISGIRWSSAEMEADPQNGMAKRYDLLSLQLEIMMSRRD